MLMIPTWLHGFIDYSVASLFGVASKSRRLSLPVRRILASAGATHASYALATDYELGVRPWLTMRQHLVLDTAGAAALLAGGLLLRRQPASQRALLMGAGIAELAVIAFSERTRPAHNSVTYDPLDTPKPIAPDVFLVDSRLPGVTGKVLPIRMTVIRLPDGSLLLHSPTRCTESLRDALSRIGPVAHLVAPNISHWTLLKDWQDAYPQAKTWAAPGLRQRRPVRRSGLRLDEDLRPDPPPAWGGAIALGIVPGAGGYHEVALFHHASRTLVLTDLVLNLEPAKVPPPLRPLLRLFGGLVPDGMAPPYLRLAVLWRRQEAASAVQDMLRLNPERVVFAHGQWFDRNGAEHLRRSMRWLLD